MNRLRFGLVTLSRFRFVLVAVGAFLAFKKGDTLMSPAINGAGTIKGVRFFRGGLREKMLCGSIGGGDRLDPGAHRWKFRRKKFTRFVGADAFRGSYRGTGGSMRPAVSNVDFRNGLHNRWHGQ